MQKHNDYNTNGYSRWRNGPKNQSQGKLSDKTREQEVKTAGVATGNTTAYMNYFKAVQPVELSVFSDQNRYNESESSVSRNTPMSSNSISKTMDAKNGNKFFARKTNSYNRNFGQYQENHYNNHNNRNYSNKYRKNRNNAHVKFNEFISVNNYSNEHSYQSIENHHSAATTNDSSYTDPVIKPELNQNTLSNNNVLDKNPNFGYYDSDCDSDPGDLEKMKIMTAADYNVDRYARYGIHESEIKDYVRTITYKNCIEYCTQEFIKVNINCILLVKIKI